MFSLNALLEKCGHLLLWLNKSLTPLGCLLTAAFLLCLLAIIKTIRNYRMAIEVSRLVDYTMHQDLSAVAGEDVLTAQLDLARAYIEMGNRDQANVILAKIRGQGTPAQQQDAERLMSETS